MSNDDLYKGLAMFKEGMSQYQIAKAANDAREQVSQLNQMELSREDALKAHTAIAQDLTLRLGAAGADPGRIQAIAGDLAPSMGAQFQADTNKDLQASGQAFQSREKALDRDLQRELAYAQLNAMKAKTNSKLDEREIAFLQKNQSAFDSKAKKALDAINQLGVVKDALNSNNPVADASVVNFMARASGEVGALTEADKAPFGGSQAFAAKLAQAASNAKTGRLTPENRAFLKQLVAVYEKAQKRNILTIREQVAARAANAAKTGKYNLSKEEIAQTLYTLDEETQTAPKTQGAGGGAAATPPAQSAPDLKNYLE